MIQELDTVVLTRDIPEETLRKGDLGTVVLVHENAAACEVEFATLDGQALALVALPPMPCAQPQVATFHAPARLLDGGRVPGGGAALHRCAGRIGCIGANGRV